MNSLSPSELVLLASAVATEIAKCRSIDEIYMVKNFLNQVTHTLGTIAFQQVFEDKKKAVVPPSFPDY